MKRIFNLQGNFQVSNSMKPNRFKELDALRGIAALMVVLFHFTMGRPEAKYGFKLGTTGVDLFFIISGFVIFMSLTKIKKSIDFVVNRISRLYPTYWACVTFTFVLISINKNDGLGEIELIKYLGNMTMFQFYLKISNLDGPYWTMIIEMLFYIGILFLFHFKIIKYLNVIGIILTSLTVIITTFFYEHFFVLKIVYGLPLLPFIPLFFAGTIFYKIYTFKSKLFENYAIIIFCLTSQILLFKYAGRSKGYINHAEYGIMLIFYFTLFSLFVHNKLSFIVSKYTLFLGKISFALYLTHQYISLGITIPFLTNKLNVNFWIASLVVSLPIVILVAFFITYYIEIPMNKQMKEKLQNILSV